MIRLAAPLVVTAALVGCGSTAPPTGALSHHEERASSPGDRDDDGVADDRDGCPDVAEDLDLHQDADGCPELDDDHDGVPDLDDRCVDTPGPAPSGCGDDCSFMVTTDDCWFVTPIWSAESGPRDLAAVARSVAAYPEIRQITLSTTSRPGDLPAIARGRLDTVRRALITAGVPAAKLAIDPDVPSAQRPPHVFGEITKQWLAPGKFRSVECVDKLGPVYRVARARTYDCHPRICGDGACWHPTEDDRSCPADCPP